MDNVPPHSVPPLPTNPGAIHGFADALFRYADSDSWVSLRVFAQRDNAAPSMRIAPVRARDPAALAARATPTVFRSPVATFASADSAAMDNMANGLAIALDVDMPTRGRRCARPAPSTG